MIKIDKTLIKVMVVSTLLGMLFGLFIVAEFAPEQFSQINSNFNRVGYSE